MDEVSTITASATQNFKEIQHETATPSSPVTLQQLEPPDEPENWLDQIEEVLGPVWSADSAKIPTNNNVRQPSSDAKKSRESLQFLF
jgi:hypothetical protein